MEGLDTRRLGSECVARVKSIECGNNVRISLLILLMIMLSSTINATPLLTISNPGVYKLRGDLSGSTTAAGDSIISITASDVELDLGGYKVVQTGSKSGIKVASSLTNVTIRNGIVLNSGTGDLGITVGASCSKIMIDTVNVQGWTTSAMHMVGGSGTEIKNVAMRNCRITNNAISVSPWAICNLTYCNNISIIDCVIDNNTTNTPGTAETYGLYLLNSNACRAERLVIQGNSATAGFLYALALSATTNSVFYDCSVSANTALKIMYGFYLTGSSYNVFDNCLAQANVSGAADPCAGFFNTGSSNGTLYLACTAESNEAAGVSCAGFYGNSGTKLIYKNCLATSNFTSAGSLPCYGFFINSTVSSSLYTGCTAGHQRATGVAYGFYDNYVSATYNEIIDCVAFDNGTTASDFGFFTTNSATTTFCVRSRAYQNGTAGGNGFSTATIWPVGTQTTATPWVNLEI